ncbi:hypothetical protein PAXRUDRAFT_773889 [Paxillus rubicundulus Ve08.2h10]|uniref:Uncharacterized protein n=1 Tax=Paxillus rubicundulus Ve08.2h10 TaxID=930991 RepID=A0A0D0DCD2_9AGAM|nr:hypothetical protein PAXRUDRAFT_773889 [Paxillus rubicundulus Ve08.2h10]
MIILIKLPQYMNMVAHLLNINSDDITVQSIEHMATMVWQQYSSRCKPNEQSTNKITTIKCKDNDPQFSQQQQPQWPQQQQQGSSSSNKKKKRRGKCSAEGQAKQEQQQHNHLATEPPPPSSLPPCCPPLRNCPHQLPLLPFLSTHINSRTPWPSNTMDCLLSPRHSTQLTLCTVLESCQLLRQSIILTQW